MDSDDAAQACVRTRCIAVRGPSGMDSRQARDRQCQGGKKHAPALARSRPISQGRISSNCTDSRGDRSFRVKTTKIRS
jgi:hypothetical protein